MAKPLLRTLLYLLAGCLPLAGEGAVFTEVAVEAGLTHVQSVMPANPEAVDYAGGGVAVGDYNGDGWPDLFMTRHGFPGILYRNNGDGTFSEATAAAGLPVVHLYDSMGAAFADLDNDGDPDLVVTTLGHPRFYLYINRGGVFSEEAELRGADLATPQPHNGYSVAIGDYDRDGYLDLAFADWTVPVDDATVHLHSSLLRNRGAAAPGHFENVTLAADVAQRSPAQTGGDFQFVHTPALIDADLDNWPDLFITADFYESRLYWNDGDGTFTDGTLRAETGSENNGTGGGHGDFDGDGWPDWFVTANARSPEPGSTDQHFGNRLYRNNGDRTFRDNTSTAGVRNGGWGTGGVPVDYDNDGDLDLFMVNGIKDPTLAFDDPAYLARPVLWTNDGTGRFTETGLDAGLSAVRHSGGVAAFDYDGDGDLDLVVATTAGQPQLFRNDGPNGSFLRIRPEGFLSNRDGINTKIWVQAVEGGPVQYREFNPTGLYLSSGEPVAHFGLGDHEGPVHSVRLRWTSGLEAILYNVEPNTEQIIEEPLPVGLESPLLVASPQPQTVFRGQAAVFEVEASGYPTPEYQWFHDNVLLPGETGPRLEFDSVQPVDAGHYHVRVFNLAGETGSNPVELEVRLSAEGQSVARRWNEAQLDAIRLDYPSPTVHSRNLFHVSAAMWDAWAAYDPVAKGVFFREKHTSDDLEAAREEAISHAAYTILMERYQYSPGKAVSFSLFRALMHDLGYDPDNTLIDDGSPAALGNRIGQIILSYGLYDGANEENGYIDDTGYAPVNEAFNVNEEGTVMVDPNRWQPLSFDFAVTQNGLPLGASTQVFLGSNWGKVKPFAMTKAPGEPLYHDPGPPPLLGSVSSETFKQDAVEVIRFSSLLDPTIEGMGGEVVDIGPATSLNNPLGTNDGTGYNSVGGNPATGEPYAPNPVKVADYARVLAEYWADGPASETPPGHWNTLANDLQEHPFFSRRFTGEGSELDPLEWDVKVYLALNGAVSDAAIAAWGAKAFYDYPRPVSMIRYMAGLGQSSDPGLYAYHPDGLLLVPGLVELITEASAATGERHAHLANRTGEIAVFAWLGQPDDPETEIGGVGWMPGVLWSTYQLRSFVTPPFAGYVSGHSTFSRAAAEVLAAMTGTPYFPGGLGTRSYEGGSWLEFEAGPSQTFELQWATYYDAADQAGISRLYGGIHVRSDDFQGRIMGSAIGKEAWEKARGYFNGTASEPVRGVRYHDWAEVRLVDRNTDPQAILTHDGLSNRELYAFALSPDSPDRAGLPTFTYLATDPPVLRLTYERPLAATDLDYHLEQTRDFLHWEPVPEEQLSSARETARPGVERWITFIDPGNSPARFYRLIVTTNFANATNGSAEDAR